MNYARHDDDMHESTFPEQVQELSLNLHRILLDTVKMQEFQDVISVSFLFLLLTLIFVLN